MEYSYYYQAFYARSEKSILKKINEHKKEVIYDINGTIEDIFKLKTQKSTKEFLNDIKKSQEIRNSTINENPFDIFNFE